MSNILIIKHGSLGDIAQACGAIQDISENHEEDQIHLLTTKPYFELFKKNPFVQNVILDKRLSRFNLIYLYQITRNLKNLNFNKIYDLQNSSRTVFYKNILFPKAKFDKWSSSETTLPTNIPKVEFDKKPVLNRFDHQLKTSGLNTLNTMKPDFSWACTNIDSIKKNYDLVERILVPTNLSHVRMNSGLPIFVDWKHHAFRFDQLIEWEKRIILANKFYNSKSENDQLLNLKKIQIVENISHILIKKDELKKECSNLINHTEFALVSVKNCYENKF